jgi:hypothetical protein
VSLSLPEVACVHLLHRAWLGGVPVLPGCASPARRRRARRAPCGGGCSALEAMQCRRFFDSDTEYGERQLNMLLRALQPDVCELRATPPARAVAADAAGAPGRDAGRVPPAARVRRCRAAARHSAAPAHEHAGDTDHYSDDFVTA